MLDAHRDTMLLCVLGNKSSSLLLNQYQVSRKRFTHLAGCEIKCMRQIYKTEMLSCQSKASLDGKSLFGRIIHHLDTQIRKMLERSMFGNKDSTLHSGP